MKLIKLILCSFCILFFSQSIAQTIDLATPKFSNKVILKWSEHALLTTFTYKYSTYVTDFSQAQQFYTANAWWDVQKLLIHQSDVVSKKMIIKAKKLAAPVIKSQDVENKVYTWIVLMPITVTYQTKTARRDETLEITALVAQTLPNIGVKGLAIEAFKGDRVPPQ